MGGRIGISIEKQLQMEHETKAKVAEIRIKGIQRDNPTKLDAAIDRVLAIIKEKDWVNQPAIIQDCCPLCENLVKYDKKPIIHGVHNDCILKLIEMT